MLTKEGNWMLTYALLEALCITLPGTLHNVCMLLRI